MLTVTQVLSKQLKDSRDTFESTAADIQAGHWHKEPGGKALPLAAIYAHLIFSEDGIIQGMLQNKPPLFASTWKTKTGASAPLPAMDAAWEKSHQKWAKQVKLDLKKFANYRHAVYKATDKYVAALTPKALSRQLDLGPMGKHTVLDILSNWVIGHNHNLAGELSAIKGVFGAKGYPF